MPGPDHDDDTLRDSGATESAADPREGPRRLREALAAYVHALHRGWLERVRAAGADLDGLPLTGEPFTVAVVAARRLHLVATRDALPGLAGHEAPVEDALDGMTWRVRFLDPTVVPALADPSAAADPVAALGITTTLYRLEVGDDGALSPHQATHAGHGLAAAHLRTGHD